MVERIYSPSFATQIKTFFISFIVYINNIGETITGFEGIVLMEEAGRNVKVFMARVS